MFSTMPSTGTPTRWNIFTPRSASPTLTSCENADRGVHTVTRAVEGPPAGQQARQGVGGHRLGQVEAARGDHGDGLRARFGNVDDLRVAHRFGGVSLGQVQQDRETG